MMAPAVARLMVVRDWRRSKGILMAKDRAQSWYWWRSVSAPRRGMSRLRMCFRGTFSAEEEGAMQEGWAMSGWTVEPYVSCSLSRH